MGKMTKKERVAKVFDLKEPDYIPVFPRNQAQMIYSMGWKKFEMYKIPAKRIFKNL